MNSEQLSFPKDFLFGVAVSGGQTEGNHNSDWEQFEKKNAERLSLNPEKRDFGNGRLQKRARELLIPELSDPNNYRSGDGIGWREGRYTEDLDIAQDLGLKIIRFSPERSFIEPQEGVINNDAITHYKKFIEACRERGIEPMMTLFHFTNPTWISDKGGWENKEIIENFSHYSETLLQLLDTEFQFLLTINEADIYSYMGWIRGEYPPEKKNSYKFFQVRENLSNTHKRLYERLKQTYPDMKISSPVQIMDTQPKTNNIFDRVGTIQVDKILKSLFLPKIVEYTDFIALNQYMFNKHKGLIHPISGNFKGSYVDKRSDIGWYLNPESMYNVLTYLHRQYRGKPIFITENGLADKTDTLRPWYIAETLKYVKKAMDEGVDVMGYLHWTLTDNFEWDKGRAAKFGLVSVDPKTQERSVRDSARLYSDIIKKREPADL